jgi:hypothetical protein
MTTTFAVRDGMVVSFFCLLTGTDYSHSGEFALRCADINPQH